MEQSSQAMSQVNVTLLDYFDERQLVVFRAAILFAFISPYLRGKNILICTYLILCSIYIIREDFKQKYKLISVLMGAFKEFTPPLMGKFTHIFLLLFYFEGSPYLGSTV